MLCPVCGKETTTNRICACGYDPTCDYEHRPTLSALNPRDWLQASAIRSDSLITDAENQLTTLIDPCTDWKRPDFSWKARSNWAVGSGRPCCWCS